MFCVKFYAIDSFVKGRFLFTLSVWATMLPF
jgi:hypothetical protein